VPSEAFEKELTGMRCRGGGKKTTRVRTVRRGEIGTERMIVRSTSFGSREGEEPAGLASGEKRVATAGRQKTGGEMKGI